ncbi:hypothetical protein BT93_G1761 [Corymbia citriodora subsp. variegata]|nr:hypothetical protein BT93_G1761 [Corymbia citriodora subsp. variegata]
MTISSLERTSPPRATVRTRPYMWKRDRRTLRGQGGDHNILTPPRPTPRAAPCSWPPPSCSVPGGYTGNFFHEFSDDVTLAVVDCRDWWLRRYVDVLSGLSHRPVINLDRQKEAFCFPFIMSLRDFASFLDGICGGGGAVLPPLSPAAGGRPRLVWVSRPRSAGRAFLNLAELEALAERIGFEVRRLVPMRGMRLTESYGLVQGSHAMVGVHGATMTHEVFLWRGLVLLQVVPVGTTWLSEAYFGRPARELGLEHVEYRIAANDSSLAEEYGVDSVVLKDPRAVTQNVRLDLGRFRASLERAYVMAKAFVEMAESKLAND